MSPLHATLFFILYHFIYIRSSFFHLTYSRWSSPVPSCLWSLRMFPSLPGSRLTNFYRDASSALIELYLLPFSRFPLRKKQYKSCFDKNRTHDFRTSRCAGYLLDHSGDDVLKHLLQTLNASCGAGVLSVFTWGQSFIVPSRESHLREYSFF